MRDMIHWDEARPSYKSPTSLEAAEVYTGYTGLVLRPPHPLLQPDLELFILVL